MADAGTKVKAPRGGFSEWTVVGQPSLRELDDRLWLARGSLPNMPLSRWMTLVRMADGRVLVHNAIALSEEDMARIDAWGEVAVIVVPNRFHRLDAGIFKQRYPKAEIVVPAGARAKVEAVVPVDRTYTDFEGDEVVSLQHVDGLGEGEGVLRVQGSDGVTLAFTDLLFNVPHQKGFMGLMFRLMGSTGGPKVTRLFRLAGLKDKKALRADLERLATTEGLVRLVPGHGRVIDQDAAGTLAAVARGL